LLAAVVASNLGVVAVSIRAFESEEAKRRRAELKRQRELPAVAATISTYGRAVDQQFPIGDVVITTGRALTEANGHRGSCSQSAAE
jgi:hypothetical protein